MIARWWQRWLAYCERPVDTRPLALVRIGLSLAVVVDLLILARLGLVGMLYGDYERGGLLQFHGVDWMLPSLVGPDWAGPLAWGVALLCFALIGLGIKVRPAILVGVLAYAQLGHAYPAGDRAIDRIIRTTMLILVFSSSHKRFALGGGERAQTHPGWTEALVKWLIILIYLDAGVGKIIGDPAWLFPSEHSALYRIMTDPLAAYLDPVAWESWGWLFFAGSVATVVVECAAPLILTRWMPHFAAVAIWIHIGIAATMKLGMFSYAMMALYPVLFAPWLLPALDRAGEKWVAWRAASA